MTDTKRAEKEYLSRLGSSEWERMKPFSHGNADTLIESAQLLHDFSVAMLLLRPRPDQLILDLGAGGCWCSDLLGRLNRRTVALDISVDMLRAGRSRPKGSAIRGVAGDMEQLPFRSRTFDQAVCLSAIHHVPDIPAALSEIARVLVDDGVAVFSEPGRCHAVAPISTVAMRDFGVLEQDIVLPDFVRICRDAGFRDVRIKPMAHVIPQFAVTPEQWSAWTARVRRKRPLRALRTIWRGVAEFFGVGKQTLLFDETLGMLLLRTIHGAVESHPIVVAAKREGGSPLPVSWAAHIEICRMPSRVGPADAVPIRLRVTNTGSATWKESSTNGIGHVRLGVQLLDADAHLVARDYHRVPLTGGVAPQDAIELQFTCSAPRVVGAYRLKFDMVAEGVTWFEPTGSQTTDLPLTVDYRGHTAEPS